MLYSILIWLLAGSLSTQMFIWLSVFLHGPGLDLGTSKNLFWAMVLITLGGYVSAALLTMSGVIIAYHLYRLRAQAR